MRFSTKQRLYLYQTMKAKVGQNNNTLLAKKRLDNLQKKHSIVSTLTRWQKQKHVRTKKRTLMTYSLMKMFASPKLLQKEIRLWENLPREYRSRSKRTPPRCNQVRYSHINNSLILVWLKILLWWLLCFLKSLTWK
jgi:hypothetical protein